MKSAYIRSSISSLTTMTLLWLRSIIYCNKINAWFLSYSSDSMLAYFTIIFLFMIYADWSGHSSGTYVHFNLFYGRTLVMIGLNLNGVIILVWCWFINCYAYVWVSILTPKSKLVCKLTVEYKYPFMDIKLFQFKSMY